MKRYLYYRLHAVVLLAGIVTTSVIGAATSPCEPQSKEESCGCNNGRWIEDKPSCLSIDLRGEVSLDHDEWLVPPAQEPIFCSGLGGGIALPQSGEVALRTAARVVLDLYEELTLLAVALDVAGREAEVLGLHAKFKGEVEFRCNRTLLERRSFELKDFMLMETNRFSSSYIFTVPERADEYKIEIRMQDAEGRARVHTTNGSKEWRPIGAPDSTMIFRGRRR